RDQRKGRVRHETKYPLLEDCGKTKPCEWSSVTFWSWPRVPGEASRLLPLCEEADRFCSMGAFPLVAHRDILRCRTTPVAIGATRTLLSHHDDGFIGTRPSAAAGRGISGRA